MGRIRMQIVFVVTALLFMASSSRGNDHSMSLKAVISEFVTTTSKVGSQIASSPIDEAEVLAAIRLALEDKHDLGDDAQHFLSYSATGEPLPSGTKLELNSLRDLGGQFVYDSEDIFLSIPLKDDELLRIPVRQRLIRSRTLSQEIDRLESVLKNTPARPGRYRLEDRVKELTTRVQKVR